jgi:ABC-type Mn2+/Zn2+ transport system ATPase subunit
LRDLTVSYGGHPAVHHLSGTFAADMLTAVVGPNGAGKSTLRGALGGTIRDFEGRIERDVSQRVAYLPQASALDRSFRCACTRWWPWARGRASAASAACGQKTAAVSTGHWPPWA